MATRATSLKDEPVPMRQRLVNARLLTLLRVSGASGQLAYRRAIDMTGMQLRIISQIGNFGPLNSADLVWLTGSDKAQISRAVKALDEADLVERPSLRSTISLTAAGRAIFDRIMAIAHDRDEALARGLGKRELKRFASATERLTARAAQLLACERQASQDAGDGDPYPEPDVLRSGPPSAADEVSRPLSRMILPPLVTLVSYLQRAGTIAYKREIGISQFEWELLSQIAEHAPVSLAELIVITGRDKSHIGRTLKRLVGSGWVTQQRSQGKRETILQTTASGARIYDDMCAIAIRRDDFLFADQPPGTRDDYVATIEKLTANAEAMLRDERRRSRG